MSKTKSTTLNPLSSSIGASSAGQSNKKRKSENRIGAANKRSPFPRSPRHGKHSLVQGDPNTIGHAR